jgi:dihydroorotate dehydrogenase (NAD+) catalytic subunit
VVNEGAPPAPSDPTSSRPTSTTPDLRVELAGLELANPILTASGTFGYGLEFAHLTKLERLGGIVTKGLSPEPLRGNPPPRVCETRGGMINSIGLQNIGIDRFVADVLPGLRRYPAKVIVNVFGYSTDDYLRVVDRCEASPEIAALELNVSCPNVERGGIEFGHDPEALRRLVAAVRERTRKPLAVKLSPNVTSPVDVGLAAKDGGADILSCINTVIGMAIDAATRRPLINTVRGGLSGPAIKPIALRIVYDVARKVGLPVIGIGGVETATDVVEFLLAGASAVQVGTALFRDPRTPERLIDGLETWLRESGTARAADLIGALEQPALVRAPEPEVKTPVAR